MTPNQEELREEFNNLNLLHLSKTNGDSRLWILKDEAFEWFFKKIEEASRLERVIESLGDKVHLVKLKDNYCADEELDHDMKVTWYSTPLEALENLSKKLNEK